MRVMLVSGSLPPVHCGVGSYTLQLARALAARPGIVAGVLTGTEVDLDGDDRVVVLPAMTAWAIGEIGRVFRAIRQWRPDVIHLQYPAKGYSSGLLPSLVPLLGWVMGARVVRTWHEVTRWNDVSAWRDTVLFALQAMVPGRIIVVRSNYRQLLHPLLGRLIRHRRLDYVRSCSTIPRSLLSPAGRAGLRAELVGAQRRLIVFFGFLLPPKGADLLFEIADPATDALYFLGGFDPDGSYYATLATLAATPAWRGKVCFGGFRPDVETADILAAADAVVLPFRDGAGDWNTSLHAAALQGSTVVSTSTDRNNCGHDQNVQFCMPGDIAAMRAAIAHGQRRSQAATGDEWQRVADDHLAVYRGQVTAVAA